MTKHMKFVVGIDYRGGYRTSIDVLESLGFNNESFTFVHGWGSKQSPNQVIPNMNILGNVLEREAENLMRNANADATGVLPNVQPSIVPTQAITALFDAATLQLTDYLVVAPTVRSNSTRSFGATTHALIECMATNLIIAREKKTDREIKQALFITDGTEEAREALKTFTRKMPKSVERVVVLDASRESIPVAVGERQATLEGHEESAPRVTSEILGGVEYSQSAELLQEFIYSEEDRLIATYSDYKGKMIPMSEILSVQQTLIIIKTY
jgi:hypothetical protein